MPRLEKLSLAANRLVSLCTRLAYCTALQVCFSLPPCLECSATGNAGSLCKAQTTQRGVQHLDILASNDRI